MLKVEQQGGAPPLVVVYMITYNHGQYIKQAIESVLSQRTTFDFQLFIGEDKSTDNTTEICRTLQQLNPSRIQFFPNSHNLGASRTAVNTLLKCFDTQAKYIAMIEGDDYWTDPLKLQKQVDFLQAHDDFSICFHPVYELKDSKLTLTELKLPRQDDEFDMEDLATGNFMHTVSVIFRNGIIKEFPDWYFEATAGDYIIHMWNATQGKIKMLADPMAVYRRHDTGIWSSQSYEKGLKKWILLLGFLKSAGFKDGVINILSKQRMEKITTYLGILYYYDEQKYLSELQRFSLEDPAFSQVWIQQYYPVMMANNRKSRIYKLSDRLKKIGWKLSRKK